MRFLQRLHNRLKIEARPKKGKDAYRKQRKAVRDQLKDMEEPNPPEKAPPAKKEQPAPEQKPEETSKDPQSENPAPDQKSELPETTEQPTEEEPAAEGMPTGYGELAEDRFGTVLSYKPYLVIVSGSGKNNMDALTAFLDKNNVIQNPKESHRIFGPKTLNTKDTEPLKVTLAYLVATKAINPLTKRINTTKVPATVVDLTGKIKSANPFDSLKLSEELNKAVGGEDVNLRKGLLAGFGELKDTSVDMSFGDEPSLQLSYLIPLDYFRFLSFEHKAAEFYVGGHPDDAGRTGLLYAVCDKPQANLFLKTMKEFKPPKNFSDDLYFPATLDAGFRRTEPRKVRTNNCVILESETKFDKEKDLDSLTGIAEVFTKGLDFNDYAEKLKEGKIKAGHAGKYVDGTHVKGNLKVHFSLDFKKAILWCGTSPVQISNEDENRMKESLGLVNIDKSFSK